MKKGKILKTLAIAGTCLCAPLLLSGCTSGNENKTDFRVQDGYIQVTKDGTTWENLVDLDTLKGLPGDDADVWTIGENGNWYKNGIDTGDKAVGTDGVGITSITKNTNLSTSTLTVYDISFSNGTSAQIEIQNGEDGDNADVWTIGNDGYWYKNGDKTDKKAVGTDGDDGNGIKSITKDETNSTAEKTIYIIELEDGTKSSFEVINGTNGEDADVWTIGNDGYWYKNGDKTDKKAVGTDGGKGEDGKDGDKGETGMSAYEIYCSHKPNYKKTEIEWMNDLIESKLLGLASNLGDVDENGKIDTGDVTYIGQYLAGTPMNDTNIYNADIDANGQITEADRYLLQKYLSNQDILSLPSTYLMGDVNLDGEITEDDYTELSENSSNLTQLQKIIGYVSYTDSLEDSLIILRKYLDGELPSLNNQYCIIRFDLNGLQYTPDGYVDMMIVQKGQKITNLPNLELESLTFEGWYNNGEQITEDTIIEKGMTLTATYNS